MFIKLKLPIIVLGLTQIMKILLMLILIEMGFFDVTETVDTGLIWNYLDNSDIQQRIEISAKFFSNIEGFLLCMLNMIIDNDVNVIGR
jgi:hypothetical protein